MRGPCVFHTNGTMAINGVDYPPGDPMTADGIADAQAFQEAFDSCVSELAILMNVGVTPIPFLAPVAYYGVFFTFFFFCRASLRAFLPSCVSSFFFVANAAFRLVLHHALSFCFCLVFSFFFFCTRFWLFILALLTYYVPPVCFFCHAARFSFSSLRPFHVLAHRACLSL